MTASSHWLGVLLAFMLVLFVPSAAFAHASLVKAEPADGAMLAVTPPTVVLRFNEAVAPAVIQLIDAEGKSRPDITVTADDDTIRVGLPATLPHGTQVLSYRIISADGHPVSGAVQFSIGRVSGATSVGAHNGMFADAGASLGWAIWLSRFGVYLGLFAGIGGAFFMAVLASARQPAPAALAALGLGLASAIASLGVQGLDLLGLGFGDLATSAPWRAALATSLGPSLGLGAAAMLAGLAALICRSDRLARVLAVSGLIGVGLSLAATGHAAHAPPQVLTRSAVFLHGIGAAYWAGALLPLALMARRPGPELLAALSRFSRLAVPLVAVLALSGLGLAVIQLDRPAALIDTAYGQVLTAKLVLVALLLALAAFNRFRLTPALPRAPSNTRALIRSIGAEVVLVLAILGLVAGWRFTPPPRVTAAVAAARVPVNLHIHTDKGMVDIVVSPGAVGPNSFDLQFLSADFGLLAPRDVRLTLAQSARGIAPFMRRATRRADGNWELRDMVLPFAGRWQVTVDAYVTDFDLVTLDGELEVKP
ncbi:copper resistance CopC/CopD family protein [Phreatobacter stygius]|nr:CopD family protein [Phreatobacter stygius]